MTDASSRLLISNCRWRTISLLSSHRRALQPYRLRSLPLFGHTMGHPPAPLDECTFSKPTLANHTSNDDVRGLQPWPIRLYGRTRRCELVITNGASTPASTTANARERGRTPRYAWWWPYASAQQRGLWLRWIHHATHRAGCIHKGQGR